MWKGVRTVKGSRGRHIQVVRTNGARRGGSPAGQPVSKVVVKTERAVYRLRRAQAARLLRRNQLVLVDRPALRHVVRLHVFLGGRLAWCTEGWKTIRTCCRAISAGFALRVRVARLWSRRRASSHRHGSVEVLVDRGVDSFRWSRVQPLGLRGSAAGTWCGGVMLTPSRGLIARREGPKGADAVVMTNVCDNALQGRPQDLLRELPYPGHLHEHREGNGMDAARRRAKS